MLVTKVDQNEVRQLVDTFKSEGSFDKLRRKIFTAITATDRYRNVALNAEDVVDDLLKTSTPDLTKNKALDTLRKKLFALHNTQYGIMITEGLDTDETLCGLLEEIGHYVDSFLGLTKQELFENVQSQQPVEDHEVCDMEIDSDSEQGLQTSSVKEIPLSDIALPPTAYPNSNLSITTLFHHAVPTKAGMPSGSSTTNAYKNCGRSASIACTDSTNEIITARSKSLLRNSENGDTETSLNSYQAQKIVKKKFHSNSTAAVASKHYMASATRYRARRRHKACNGDFVCY